MHAAVDHMARVAAIALRCPFRQGWHERSFHFSIRASTRLERRKDDL